MVIAFLSVTIATYIYIYIYTKASWDWPALRDELPHTKALGNKEIHWA